MDSKKSCPYSSANCSANQCPLKNPESEKCPTLKQFKEKCPYYNTLNKETECPMKKCPKFQQCHPK